MNNLPSFEEFLPISARPACPTCGQDMIHTRIVADDIALNVWICSCENPEEADDVDIARVGSLTESLIITFS